KNQTFFFIIFPVISSSLLLAALIAFVASWEDFVIAFFCSSASSQTLPMYIFSMIRSGSTPMVNALSTILLGLSIVLVIIFFISSNKKTDVL
ncbi:MAG: hypothetical protein WBQ73_01160, partial [Candidatus Babeliales bacterium]